MLRREKVVAALEAKRTQFEGYQNEQRSQGDLRNRMLESFLKLSIDEIATRLAEREQPWPGALPTPELEQSAGLCMPFGRRWNSHQEARDWALETVRGKPIAAVDGSQIAPTKEISVPVGAVQIGWYVNFHAPGGRYEKDVSFEVLPPQELIDGDSGDGEFPDWRVNQRRFVAECERLCWLVARFASAPEEERPLCLFDGSFIISFAGQMRPHRAEPYLRAVRVMLTVSEENRTPLVGFVDSSSSRDVVMLVNTVVGPPNMSLTDGGLLSSLLPNWGDRSPLFVCARNDQLSNHGYADFYKEVAFSYIRLATDRPPARLEMPRWLVDSGRVDEIIDMIRAECVIGSGYPYAAESADAVAVLQQGDRERFYALLQQFAEREGMPFNVSRKSVSKQNRR